MAKKKKYLTFAGSKYEILAQHRSILTPKHNDYLLKQRGYYSIFYAWVPQEHAPYRIAHYADDQSDALSSWHTYGSSKRNKRR